MLLLHGWSDLFICPIWLDLTCYDIRVHVLMFPTIYGIALNGLKIEEAKLGSAFLIMSIVGGAVLTKLQGGMITDYGVRFSFWLPAGCFIMIALYGLRCFFPR